MPFIELMRDAGAEPQPPFCDDCYPLSLLLWLRREQGGERQQCDESEVDAVAA